MSSPSRVSFVIPTLNRGRYVVRAVDSCLALTRSEDLEIEVIVLDSMSDDGSWEQLKEKFADNPQVILAQNARGCGPTKSWLDGAKLATGKFVTFVWSDDYISEAFLTTLLPPLQAGCDIAMGRGIVRDINEDTSLPTGDDDVSIVSGEIFLFRHMGLVKGCPLPMSPTVALFTRATFDRWLTAVESWCVQPGIRKAIMWRRAIGPDLMLFLMASATSGSRIALASGIVAQFSSHPDSITVSSSTWPLRLGYWLAKWWAIEAVMGHDKHFAVAPLARLVVQGRILTLVVSHLSEQSGIDLDLISSYRAEVQRAQSLLFVRVGPQKGVKAILSSAFGLAWRMAARLRR